MAVALFTPHIAPDVAAPGGTFIVSSTSGSAPVSPILVWDGAAWVARPILEFDGTTWVPA